MKNLFELVRDRIGLSITFHFVTKPLITAGQAIIMQVCSFIGFIVSDSVDIHLRLTIDNILSSLFVGLYLDGYSLRLFIFRHLIQTLGI
jgi:hypothetical protein